MNHGLSFKPRLLDPELTCAFSSETLLSTVAFLAYLPATYLQKLFSSPYTQLTYQTYQKNGIQIPFFFIQFHNSQEAVLLDTFINPYDYYQDQLMGLDALRALQTQPSIHLYFFDFDRQLYPDLELPNPLGERIAQLLETLMISEPWTPTLFNQTLLEFRDAFPTPQDRQTFLSTNAF